MDRHQLGLFTYLLYFYHGFFKILQNVLSLHKLSYVTYIPSICTDEFT